MTGMLTAPGQDAHIDDPIRTELGGIAGRDHVLDVPGNLEAYSPDATPGFHASTRRAAHVRRRGAAVLRSATAHRRPVVAAAPARTWLP